MIELDNVVKRFGTRTAVNGLSLRVEQGELFAFLGPNGAGKTTTIKMICGLLFPTEGEVRVGGHDLRTDGDRARQTQNLETFSLVGNLAIEYLDFNSSKTKSIKLKDCSSLIILNLLNPITYGMGSTVEHVELENIPQLKKLDLGFNPHLKTLFIKDLSMLERIPKLSEGVKKIHFENLDALTELDLSSLQNLEEVVFKGSFANLKQINFNKSEKLHEIEGLENKEMFPNLKNIIITNTPELTDFKKAALKEKYESVEVEVPQVSQTSPHSSPMVSRHSSHDEEFNGD